MKLKDVIRAVAMSRVNREALKQYRADAHAAMLRTEEGVRWAELDEDYKSVNELLKDLESALRERAIYIYARAVRIFGIDVNRRHWKGITIKDYTVVEVNPEVDLLEWVQVNAPLLVEQKVDMKTFNSLVKTGKIPAGIAWVVKEPRAQIAGKL